MKPGEFVSSKIIAPLLVALLTPVITGIASKAKTGDWKKGFAAIPKSAWIAFVAIIVLWTVLIIIRNRFHKIRDKGPYVAVISSPLYGWIDAEKWEHAGVLWKVRAPAPAPFEHFDPSEVSPSELEVDTPPRCPECETELEQSKSFWGGYIWRCVSCDFRKRNRHSYYREADHTEKIVKREWEKLREDGIE